MTEATVTAFLLWSEEFHQVVEKESARSEQRGKRSPLSHLLNMWTQEKAQRNKLDHLSDERNKKI